MKPTPILIRNVPSTTLKALQTKMPTASTSLIVRAFINHAITLSNEEFAKIVNKQAQIETKGTESK